MTLKEILSGKVAVRVNNYEKAEFEGICNKEGYSVANRTSKRIVLDCYAESGGYIDNSAEIAYVVNGYTIITFEELKERLK